jgi:HPt (histidine-containing phosphotransfer) domain-containing protein
MDIQWNTTVIDPKELILISRGNKMVIHKYLLQFQKLIPERIESLNLSLNAQDRKQVRQILHQMSPQLQFFGIPNIIIPIRRLELEYETMPIIALKELVHTILTKLHLALTDVEIVLKENF